MIENTFLESGFSFTMAKLLPYIITLIIGLLIVFILRNQLRYKNAILRKLVKLCIIFSPFIIYFYFSPIYQGDFSNNSVQVKRSTETEEISGEKLIVISIPGCPFCKEAMGKMLLLKERNPNLEIEFLVCSKDARSLSFYTETSKGIISVRLAKDPEAMAELAEHRFPTFILSEKVGSLKRWSNDNFGVRALDEVESLF